MVSASISLNHSLYFIKHWLINTWREGWSFWRLSTTCYLALVHGWFRRRALVATSGLVEVSAGSWQSHLQSCGELRNRLSLRCALNVDFPYASKRTQIFDWVIGDHDNLLGALALAVCVTVIWCFSISMDEENIGTVLRIIDCYQVIQETLEMGLVKTATLWKD